LVDVEFAPIVNLKRLTIISIFVGFFVIPFHEFGHMLGYWITGHRAAMSYARAYLVPDGPDPFLAVLCGPSLPIVFSAICVFLAYKRWNLSVLYPVMIIGSFDRLGQYLLGWLPSDEADLAMKMGWEAHTFKYIFMSAEIILLLLVAISLLRNRIKLKHSMLILLIPLGCFGVCASVGIFVVERYVFPAQFKLQFGSWLS
jgi:hypothetical protein